MEIKLGNGKVVDAKNPKGRHVKKAFKILMKVQNIDGSENLSAVDEYMDYLDKIACELTGMEISQLDDLDSDDKNKIVSFYDGKVQGRIDFLKSSLRSGSSEQKDTSESLSQ